MFTHFKSRSHGPEIAAPFRTELQEALGTWIEASPNPVAVAEEFALQRTAIVLKMFIHNGYVDEEKLCWQLTEFCKVQTAEARRASFTPIH